MRITDWSSDGCSAELPELYAGAARSAHHRRHEPPCAWPAHRRAALCEFPTHRRRSLSADGRRAEPRSDRTLLRSRRCGAARLRAAARCGRARAADARRSPRSEEHTSELQSLMRISYAVFCLKKKNILITHAHTV